MPQTDASQFEKLVEAIPYHYITLSDEIVAMANERLKKKLNKNIYITLADHLSYAVERKKQGHDFKNALLWEIKKFYRQEYLVGVEALSLVENKLQVQLSEDEAGFIALHIVNAEMDGDLSYSMKIPEMIQDILNLNYS